MFTLLTALAVAVAWSTAVESRFVRADVEVVAAPGTGPADAVSEGDAADEPELSARPELRRTKSCPWRDGMLLNERTLVASPPVCAFAFRCLYAPVVGTGRAPKALGSRGPPSAV